MKIQNKKGIELSQAFGAVLAVVLVAVLVIIAIFLFDVLGDSFPTVGNSTLNEFDGFLNDSTYTVDNAGACNFGSFAVTGATNVSNDVIGLGNLTITSTGGITNATDSTFHAPGNITYNYTYTQGTESCQASDDLLTQFATYPALVGLVGTIIFLGIVIGVLVASFIFGGRRQV